MEPTQHISIGLEKVHWDGEKIKTEIEPYLW